MLTKIPTSLAMYNYLLDLEKEIAKLPNVQYGRDVGELEHSFAPGQYIRKISVPKGTILVSYIHKTEHPYFLMSGAHAILTEEKGWIVQEAPATGITPAGTKRAVLILEDVVFITVHKTDKTDIDEIEEEIFTNDYILEEVA